LLLAGCAVTPACHRSSANILASAVCETAQKCGAIFQSASYRPLYEDAKPRMVGDVLTNLYQ
jgi:flagellar basal body L-ring protein FlgH